MYGARGQQFFGVAPQERIEHVLMVQVQQFSVRLLDVHHQLDGFGDVPSGFEHVNQSSHARRPGQTDMEMPALAMVALRVVFPDRLLQ